MVRLRRLAHRSQKPPEMSCTCRTLGFTARHATVQAARSRVAVPVRSFTSSSLRAAAAQVATQEKASPGTSDLRLKGGTPDRSRRSQPPNRRARPAQQELSSRASTTSRTQAIPSQWRIRSTRHGCGSSDSQMRRSRARRWMSRLACEQRRRSSSGNGRQRSRRGMLSTGRYAAVAGMSGCSQDVKADERGTVPSPRCSSRCASLSSPRCLQSAIHSRASALRLRN